MDDINIAKTEHKPIIDLSENEAPSLVVYEVVTNNQKAFRSENHVHNGLPYKRNKKDVRIYIRHLINLLQEGRELPTESFFLLDEILEKSISSKLSYKKLGSNEETHKSDLDNLTNLRSKNLPYPEKSYSLLNKLLKFTDEELFKRQPTFRLDCKYNQESRFEYHYGVINFIQLTPTVLRLYENNKDLCHLSHITSLYLSSVLLK